MNRFVTCSKCGGKTNTISGAHHGGAVGSRHDWLCHECYDTTHPSAQARRICTACGKPLPYDRLVDTGADIVCLNCWEDKLLAARVSKPGLATFLELANFLNHPNEDNTLFDKDLDIDWSTLERIKHTFGIDVDNGDESCYLEQIIAALAQAAFGVKIRAIYDDEKFVGFVLPTIG